MNRQSAEYNTPRLLRNMAFLKLHKNIAFQNVLRVSKNVSPVNPVLNRIAQDMELCHQPARQHSSRKSWCKSMSAFANTLGGALIFGMADDGQIVGLTEPDSDAEKISEIIKTRMEPIQ